MIDGRNLREYRALVAWREESERQWRVAELARVQINRENLNSGEFSYLNKINR